MVTEGKILVSSDSKVNMYRNTIRVERMPSGTDTNSKWDTFTWVMG